MRRLAHVLILAVASIGASAIAVVADVSPAAAKPNPRPLITEHHAQSRLTRIPKVRRVQRPSHRTTIVGFARRWDHHAKRAGSGAVDLHAAQAFGLLEAEELDASTPIVEELEIETVLSEFLIDDPAKRLLTPEVRVVDAPIAPPIPSEPEVVPIEIDRPSFTKRMIRMHPKLLDSGDDAASIS